MAEQSQDFVPEPVPRRAVPPQRRVPLDQLDPAAGEAMVQRVVQMRLDEARIAAAKFSSFI